MKIKVLVIGCLSIVFAVVAVIVFEYPATGQRPNVADNKQKLRLLENIRNAPDVQQRVLENADTPIKITDARVKVISGTEFSSLVGKTTDLVHVSSLPEVKFVNVSGKAIAGFMLCFRNPESRKSQTITFRKLSLGPNELYAFSPNDFVSEERVTVSNEKGTRQEAGKSKMESEKYWIALGNQSEYFVAIGKVDFVDGSTWIVKEEGGIQ